MNLGVNALQTTFDVETMKKNGIDIPTKEWTWDDMDKMGAQAKEKACKSEVLLTGMTSSSRTI